MSAYSGILGKVVLSSDTVQNIKEWGLDIKNDIQDDTEFTDTWKSNLPGLLGASGSFKGCMDPDDTNGQVALDTAMLAGTTVALKLYVNTTNYWSLTARLTDHKSSNKVDGKVEVEYGFESTGEVTFV